MTRPTAPPEAYQPHRWAMLLTVGAGVALVVVDITVVNVALPRILGSLHLSVTDGEWINSAYSLVFAALLVTLGRLGDWLGRRRLFMLGAFVFVAGSAVAGASAGLGLLIVGRVVQGIGAATMLPATLSLVTTHFRGRDRALAFGLWGSLIAGMAAVGPLVGGWLTTDHSWRWIFYMNLPLGLALAIAAALFVPADQISTGDGFDPAGFAAWSLGSLLVVGSLIEGPRWGWIRTTRDIRFGPFGVPIESASPIIPSLIFGLALLAAFVMIERRRRSSKPVLMDLDLLRVRTFAIGNLLAMIVGLGEFGVVFVLPVFLQAGLARSPLETGVLLLAMAAGGFLGGPLAAAIVHSIRPRQVVSSGLLIEAFAVAGLIGGLDSGRVTGLLIGSLFGYGLGVGMASAQLTSVILYDIPSRQAGQASGLQSTARQMGAALGVAILGTVFVTVLRHSAGTNLATIPGLTDSQQTQIVDRVATSAGWYVAALRAWTPDFAPVVAGVVEAITTAARAAATFAGVVFIGGAGLSRLLPDIPTAHRSLEPVAAEIAVR